MNKIAASHLNYKLFNTPLLVSPAFEASLIRSMAEINLKGGIDIPVQAKKEAALPGQEKQPPANGLAVIEVKNYLSYRYDAVMDYYFGSTAYETIREEFQAALNDPNVKTIVFDINSPGGEVAGLFDLVDEIYQARGTKPIYAIFNDYGFSAAYAIASAADKRFISRTGSAGSVGVVMMHMDQSGWEANIGLVYTPIYAGARKVDFSSHAPLSDEARAVAQESVNATYELFVATVARNLGLTPAAVRATEAGIFQGKKAVEAGFADSVMSWNQFINKISNRKYGGIMKAEIEQLVSDLRTGLAALVGGNSTAAAGSAPDVVTAAEAESQIQAAEAEGYARGKIDGIAVGKAEGQESGKQESQARTIEILEACAVAGTDLTAALGYVREASLTAEGAKTLIVEAKAAAASQTSINSTVSATTTGEVSPLLANARQRAETASARTAKR